MVRSTGSTSEDLQVLRFEDGLWASVFGDDGVAVISSDTPPTPCRSPWDCVLDAVELDGGLVERISRALGLRILRALLICSTVLDECSGISVKIVARAGVEEAAEAFSRARGEIFEILGGSRGA